MGIDSANAGNEAGSIESADALDDGHIIAASINDKHRWKGFCEIESEPALFNVMLKHFGVRGVKVQEVVSLDSEMLSFLPRPVYGLIFLFKYIEEEGNKQEQSCPDQIWFANQTVNNACASVALLNIVNNVPEIELGENLRSFRDFTMTFSPALRGDAVKNFDFIRQIHNKFARKMDMLNADLLLKNEATFKAKGKNGKLATDDSEGAFHFIAFMPIHDELWKLDGLERQPMCLGPVQGDWLSQAKPDIEARMARYEEDHIEFAIQSLVRDPLLNLLPVLASNVKSIVAVTSRLDQLRPDWRRFEPSSWEAQDTETENHLVRGYMLYGLEEQDIEQAHMADDCAATLLESDDVDEILALRQSLIIDQKGLKMDIREEMEANESDQLNANSRSYDWGSRIQMFSRKVKAKEQLQD